MFLLICFTFFTHYAVMRCAQMVNESTQPENQNITTRAGYTTEFLFVLSKGAVDDPLEYDRCMVFRPNESYIHEIYNSMNSNDKCIGIHSNHTLQHLKKLRGNTNVLT